MAQRQWNALVWQLRRLVGPRESARQSDRHLLQRFAEVRDETAFTALVERHGPLVFGVCRRVLQDAADADDAFQATFCVLARRATSMAWQESISSWLYAVAHRVALRAKARLARQREHEREAAAMRGTSESTAASDPGLRSLIDAELSRLPEKYRAPIVLCYLQGQTNEEAAQQLGWPKGTVQGRLARGRELLKARLSRRGVALSVGTLAALETGLVSGAVPGALIQETVQTAIHFAVGASPAAATVPASITTLVEGVLHTMWLTKVKIAIVLLLSVGILGGLGAAAHHWWAPTALSEAKAAPLPDGEPAAQAVHKVQAFPSGIADPDGNALYVVNTDGGIDALEAKTGKLLWKSAKGTTCWPIAVVGNRLLVRTLETSPSEGLLGGAWKDYRVMHKSFAIAVLDTAKEGKEILRSEKGTFEMGGYPWLSDLTYIPRVSRRNGETRGSFLIDEQVDKNNLIITWKADFTITMGFPKAETTTRTGAGIIQVDLASGKVKTLPLAQPEKTKIESKSADRFQLGDMEFVVDQGDGTMPAPIRKLKATNKKSGQTWEHSLKGFKVMLAP